MYKGDPMSLLVKMPLAVAQHKKLPILAETAPDVSRQKHVSGNYSIRATRAVQPPSGAAAAARAVAESRATLSLQAGPEPAAAAKSGTVLRSNWKQLLPPMAVVVQQSSAQVSIEHKNGSIHEMVIQRLDGCLYPFKGWRLAAFEKVGALRYL
jgi:hypothetical protein